MKNSEVIIRPLNMRDIKEFYPDKKPERAVRGWAAEYDGRLACIAGVTRVNPYDLLAFSDVMQGIQAPRLTVWRTAVKLFGNIKSLGLDVIADPNCNIGRAPEFLKRLGFYEINGGLYKWETR